MEEGTKHKSISNTQKKPQQQINHRKRNNKNIGVEKQGQIVVVVRGAGGK